FRNIIKRISDENRSKVLIGKDKGIKYIEVPNLMCLKTSEAKEILKSKGIKFKIENEKDNIVSQSKEPYGLISERDYLVISGSSDKINDEETLGLTPSVLNLPTREAVRLLHSLDISPMVFGKGIVYKQSDIFKDENSGEKLCSLYCKLPTENNPKNIFTAKK
ncbi:MAG: hypothetical protein KKD38_00755, partial [Candidatus Delongbacteria bacterium]|nr:hypothetical protein [Candidatus Delongbacteria bacterium]